MRDDDKVYYNDDEGFHQDKISCKEFFNVITGRHAKMSDFMDNHIVRDETNEKTKLE